jgi:hypothetical protein
MVPDSWLSLVLNIFIILIGTCVAAASIAAAINAVDWLLS